MIPWPHSFDVLRDVPTVPAAYDDYNHRIVTTDVVQFRWNGWLQPSSSREGESAPDAGVLINDGRVYFEPPQPPLAILSGDRLRFTHNAEVWQVRGVVDMGGIDAYARVPVSRIV